jgi:hypothetical protein
MTTSIGTADQWFEIVRLIVSNELIAWSSASRKQMRSAAFVASIQQ